jgi:hypothetical protein
MWKGLVLVLLLAACSLQPASAPTAAPELVPTAALSQTAIPSSTPENGAPTLSIDLLLTPNRIGAATRLPDSGATSPPAGNAQALGQMCAVYAVYSGRDPANVISLRAEPSAGARQVVRVPNNALVLAVPSTLEIEAEGYHWLNIIYVDAGGQRYQGWAARDSFMEAGVRDPSVQTLRATGTQQPC